MRRTFDLVAFVFGMIMVAFAAVTLWMVLIGPVPTSWLKIAAPLFLVLVGVVGLTLSRARQEDDPEPSAPSPYAGSTAGTTPSTTRSAQPTTPTRKAER